MNDNTIQPPTSRKAKLYNKPVTPDYFSIDQLEKKYYTAQHPVINMLPPFFLTNTKPSSIFRNVYRGKIHTVSTEYHQTQLIATQVKYSIKRITPSK